MVDKSVIAIIKGQLMLRKLNTIIKAISLNRFLYDSTKHAQG